METGIQTPSRIFGMFEYPNKSNELKIMNYMIQR